MLAHLTLKAFTKNRKMIIAYLGRNVKDYRRNFLKFLERLELVCPVCGGKTTLHDNYSRHVHFSEEVERITICRVKCGGCGKTHAIIPDFIKPYKHYFASDIELTLRDAEAGMPVERIITMASIPTIKRWIREFIKLGRQAVGGLRAILKKVFDKTINDIAIIGLKTFEAMEQMLKILPEIESSDLAIGKANQWLTNHMSGIYV